MEANVLTALVEKIVEVPAGTVALTDTLDSYDWDSMSVLSLIAAIDTTLGVTLDAQKLADAVTPSDILDLINDAVRG